MKKFLFLLAVLLVFVPGCAEKKEVALSVQVPAVSRVVDYTEEVKPILERRCVVCHSCYNSPCQLKLSSYEGITRGATKEVVYNATRLMSQDPTRLFIDAESEEEWRQKKFVSVTDSESGEGGNTSFLLKFLAHKKAQPDSVLDIDEDEVCHTEGKVFFTKQENTFAPEEDKLTCAATSIEVDDYLKKHPNRGMPYGFPPLEEKEFELIRDWLVLGAPGPKVTELAYNSYFSESELEFIKKWEVYLNGEVYGENEFFEAHPVRDVKRMMMARYIFEHLFLAHISFDKEGTTFYELVRSKTQPGEPIEIIGTIRPFDDPGVDRVYYRFRRVTGTIVHKTHMVYELNERRMARYNELFMDREWLEGPVQLAEYYEPAQLNPFAVFRQIPPESRYRFLLDDIHYVIMTFIRGPVCKGQVALNVVRDHFWLLFMDPDHDLIVQNPEYLNANLDLLNIPSDRSYWFRMLFDFKVYFQESYAEKYVEARQSLYEQRYRETGIDYDSIWTGSNEMDTPALTVFRHFNNASVHKGVLGGLPRTVWVMDFPLVERVYYALVAGFNVFGNRGHQLSTRLYMDGLRQEAETYFLDFLPRETRAERMQAWYGGMKLKKIRYRGSEVETGIEFASPDSDDTKEYYKREFVTQVVNRFPEQLGIGFDNNYLPDGVYPKFPENFSSYEDFKNGFLAVSEPGSSFFKQVDEHGANLAYIRIEDIPGMEDILLSLVVHRYHQDVRTMFNEEEKLDSSRDHADFIEGYVGSYPNYFFVVKASDLRDFLELLRDFDRDDPCHVARFLKYGVNRERADFWKIFDSFQDAFLLQDEHLGGIFDLNRYYQMAVGKQGQDYFEAQCLAQKVEAEAM